MKRVVIQDDYLLPFYLKREKELGTPFRLAFLNSLKELHNNVEKACNVFGIALPTGYAWLRSWNKFGYDGIEHPFHESDQPVGRPPKLSDKNLGELESQLKSMDNWQTSEVRKLIRDKWDVELSASQVQRILKNKLGMNYSKPYPQDYRRPEDAEEQLEGRLEEAYNDLMDKGFKEEQIAIGFLDESSPQTTSNTAKTWHFGKGHVVKNTTKYKANAIGFYAIPGQSVDGFLPDSTKESIKEFLEKIKAANNSFAAIIVILDNFSSHKSKEVQNSADAIGIKLVYLPPYSPDLNPIEFIWKTVKRLVSVEFIESLPKLRELISQSWGESSKKCSFAKNWISLFLPSIVTYRKFCD